MKKVGIMIAAVLLVIGVVTFVLTQGSDTDMYRPPAQPTAPSEPAPAAQTDPADATDMVEPAATIVYNDSGFTNNAVRVPVGATIQIRNDSSNDLQFSSDDHPIHTDNEELNAATISPGETTTIVLQTAGTWGFHNHEAENHTGTLVVE